MFKFIKSLFLTPTPEPEPQYWLEDVPLRPVKKYQSGLKIRRSVTNTFLSQNGHTPQKAAGETFIALNVIGLNTLRILRGNI